MKIKADLILTALVVKLPHRVQNPIYVKPEDNIGKILSFADFIKEL